MVVLCRQKCLGIALGVFKVLLMEADRSFVTLQVHVRGR